MLVVAFVSFSLFNFVGDPINNMVGEETSDEERSELRETLGLMDPIHVQFSKFVVNASKGEFGISYLPLHHQVISWAAKTNVNVPIRPNNEPLFKAASFN